jgi:hypothetical protein
MKFLLQAIATYAQMLAQSHFLASKLTLYIYFIKILLHNVGVELFLPSSN